ncbi:SusC/RagA family TonB-linked outer membrane protein [Segetibacter sp. 3557_3]|uniref:SusC/RagA family TonB-linked outer membrane protein n=1 Tax=Segetibacter sp. 3557_3 TaxID=2547429 RepID=UPI001058715D|nr:SusC/RagA family TonB-linked outer membrane protein [Segetibacter sp. 3557_3]TDH28942.1 SusC/RagA family TonB-linked outer membrane protein [Segetibacter sp. 3557_3]
MRKAVVVLLILLTAHLFTGSLAAQTRQVQGKIRQPDGSPVAGASINVKGTTTGVVSKDDGTFTIPLNGRATLLISGVGFAEQQVSADGTQPIDVVLQKSDKQLDEVVVTAFGIRREKNTLPYAAQTISGEEVNKTRISNLASGLSGKISGLQITQGNGIGGSVNVVIRGAKSLTGNNQALFVVDGVPVDNTNKNTNGQRTGAGGYDYGNAAADINPDDIQSINVLKGAAASALYGSRAANGVIMITTKKARSGLGVTVNSGTIIGMIDPSTFVKYQKEYGAGRSDPYDRNGFLLADVDGDGTPDPIVPTFAPRSWGPRFDPNLMVYHWDAFDPASPNYKKAKPWVAPANGPETFYQTSVSTNNSVYMDGMTDKGSFKLGYTRNDERGVVPNSRVLKNILNFGSTYKLTDKLTASALVNFSKVDGKGRYGTGYDGGRNVNVTLRQFGQVNVDMQEQKDAYFRNRKNITWNWSDPKTPAGIFPAFYNNMYWTVYENYETDTRTRTFGNVSLNYTITDWLNILGRVSVDTYNENQEERTAFGSIGVSGYNRVDRSYSETNYDLLATVDREITKDLKFNGLAGINIRRNSLRSVASATSGGLIVPGLYYIGNSRGTISAPTEANQPKAVDGYFAGATFSYKNLLTLDGTIRRDRSSTLPENANAYNYYAISGSWVFSQHLTNVNWLSSGKLRANYATVGSDAPWGSVKDVYDQPNPVGSTLLFSLPNTQNNVNLRPEQTKSKELGLEMAFLRNRIGFDASYYHTNTVDQIIGVAVSTGTGFSNKNINAGNVENKGIELSIYGSPISGKNFSWNINANFTRNRNKVLSLYSDSKNLQLGSFQGGVSLNASLGQPYGILQSTTFERLNGQRLVNANGLYVLSTTTSNVIGDVNPDWIGGISNAFRYKNVSFSFLVDVRKGGDLFSLDMYYGQASGILPESVGLNDLGNPKRNTVAEGGGVILEGVTADGKPNTKRVQINSNNSYVLPQSEFVYDASYVKLREASLSYTVPAKALNSIRRYVKGIDVALIGRNLWLIHKNVPYADPEENLSSGNVQGYQSGAYPTSRSIGINVKLKF